MSQALLESHSDLLLKLDPTIPYVASQVTSDHQAQVPGKRELGLMDPRQDEVEYKRKKEKKASHMGGRGMR